MTQHPPQVDVFVQKKYTTAEAVVMYPIEGSVNAVCEFVADDAMDTTLGEVVDIATNVDLECDYLLATWRLGTEPNRMHLALGHAARDVDFHRHSDSKAFPLGHRECLGEVKRRCGDVADTRLHRWNEV